MGPRRSAAIRGKAFSSSFDPIVDQSLNRFSLGSLILACVAILCIVLILVFSPWTPIRVLLVFFSWFSAVPSLILGCLGLSGCQNDARMKGTRIALMGVTLAYAVLTFWSCAVTAAIFGVHAAQIIVKIQVGFGILLAIVKMPSMASSAVAVAITLAAITAILPQTLTHSRETARSKQAKDNLRKFGIRTIEELKLKRGRTGRRESVGGDLMNR